MNYKLIKHTLLATLLVAATLTVGAQTDETAAPEAAVSMANTSADVMLKIELFICAILYIM